MAGIAGIGEVVLHTNLVHPGYRYDDAEDPEAVTRALIALHATDPASVYLSVLARSAVSTLADVADALYERRSLVRWMAMRRTLFVFPREDIPTVHPRGQHSAGRNAPSTPDRPAATQRERPRIAGNVGSWLADLEDRTEGALARRGTATGTQLAEDEPALKTRILARAPSDRPQNLPTSAPGYRQSPVSRPCPQGVGW